MKICQTNVPVVYLQYVHCLFTVNLNIMQRTLEHICMHVWLKLIYCMTAGVERKHHLSVCTPSTETFFYPSLTWLSCLAFQQPWIEKMPLPNSYWGGKKKNLITSGKECLSILSLLLLCVICCSFCCKRAVLYLSSLDYGLRIQFPLGLPIKALVKKKAPSPVTVQRKKNQAYRHIGGTFVYLRWLLCCSCYGLQQWWAAPPSL